MAKNSICTYSKSTFRSFSKFTTFQRNYRLVKACLVGGEMISWYDISEVSQMNFRNFRDTLYLNDIIDKKQKEDLLGIKKM